MLKIFFIKHKMFFFGLLISLILVILDQITKFMAFKAIYDITEKTGGVHTYIRITPFFNIVEVWNSGVTFGMFRNLKYASIILSVITILITFGVLYLMWKSEKKYMTICLSLIIAGALGNLIDRIRVGAVADFLDFHLFGYHWPAFNLADSLVCIAVFFIIIDDFILNKNKK